MQTRKSAYSSIPSRMTGARILVERRGSTGSSIEFWWILRVACSTSASEVEQAIFTTIGIRGNLIAQLIRWQFDYRIIDYSVFLFHGRLRDLYPISWHQYWRPGNWVRIQLLPLVNCQWFLVEIRRTKRWGSTLARFRFLFHEWFEEIAVEDTPFITPLGFTNFVIKFQSSLNDNVRSLPRKDFFELARCFEKTQTFVFDFVWFPKNLLIKLIFLSVLIDSQKLPCMPMGLPKLSIEPVNKHALGPFLMVGLRVEQINRILTLLSIDETKRSGSCAYFMKSVSVVYRHVYQDIYGCFYKYYWLY